MFWRAEAREDGQSTRTSTNFSAYTSMLDEMGHGIKATKNSEGGGRGVGKRYHCN